MRILECIEKHGNGNYLLYKTKKVSLDATNNDTISYDDKSVSRSTKSEFAETDKSRVKTVQIPMDLILHVAPIFSYILDGSRHIYKVDDISIGSKIFPFMAGQIMVGCCERRSRDEFKKAELHRSFVLSLPDEFDTENDTPAEQELFCRFFCDKINESLSSLRYVKENNIKIDKILLYKTDGKESLDNDPDFYKNRGTAKIQLEMTDAEQAMVAKLCKDNKLDDEHYLIKDGSIEYAPSSNHSSHHQSLVVSNYKHVVGVSKLFNPELLSDYEGKKLSQTIANLKPFERTKVYRYPSDITKQEYAVWYLRLRKDYPRETNYSDVIKCEMLIPAEGGCLDTDLVDVISANLINEAYPVCYGKDTRWANHLYPVYLTETFCKSNYIDSNIFINLF
ncbi:MAG: hypothetical protein NC115_05205 [Bacteroidales bacterium]|nr:hypothetical protein [Bacteroidales bacterium]